MKNKKNLKNLLKTVCLSAAILWANPATEMESNVISLIGKEGFQIKSSDATFSFKPYIFLQTRGQFHQVDDEGLGLADYDNITNTGFGVQNALVGFAGKSFDIITFNIALNVAKGGSAKLMPQAWFDVMFDQAFRFKMGKFKTPMFRAFGVRLGNKLFADAPQSLITRVNIPYNLNSANPTFITGFDVGAQFHGLIKNKLEYQLGLFNGTGSGQNNATSSLSDDFSAPSWLYSARLAFVPFGAMPAHTGTVASDDLKLSIGASASYNVEANGESTNDLRYAGELSLLFKKLYFSTEGYGMRMDFTERQRTARGFDFWGWYAQTGYMLATGTQPTVRLEIMDRNSTTEDGFLLIPAVGVNQFMFGQSLKLQVMYQQLLKQGHASKFAENDDDNGIPEHKFIAQVQFAF